MAKQQRKEPWNSRVKQTEGAGNFEKDRPSRNTKITKIDKNDRSDKSDKKGDGTASTIFLSVLVFIMFAIIGGAIIFTIWDNRNPNMKSVSSNFYPAAGKSSSSTASSSATSASSGSDTSSTEASSSSSSASNTWTYKGEQNINDIETDSGVSWATLAKYNSQLNPNWGQAGNTLGPMKDGSDLVYGTVLKISK